ncbi:Zinc finger CCCH domain-containing protein [Seminavis robusta]|uniref:Zinc finger CCCH domain-containing protein n=1 Tax=Seminavis robusta TaxID=568900 RepID=A0A9N8DLK8_9STRA|nr:Zinc finger CCCH domain-containing protein [Seminavis robusta]|eukprot:Sro151_g069330.1 Zinc finger CCCH domain-containing protein (606) ;mRNA; f:101616-103433
MSVPSPYNPRGAMVSTDPREDCRDYLRTGRCKYGASCKYNHPSNVQSGGGMKAPVDPSEPMFPVRPNEPVCQYYMKHGTCKFGQACKFHHPPHSSVTAALVGGGAVVVNMGRKNDVPHMVMNPIGDAGGSNGTTMMLQFLPQRPDEQDCIFFLKNGRCKYGATCRYHHPISFNQRRDDGRRQRVQVQQVPEGFLPHAANVQFISQAGASLVNYQQGPSSSSNPSHMVVTDGPVAYMTVDGSQGKGSYQAVPVVTNNDGYCAPVGAPISHNQDHTSSTSSIASSYDTANSNLDHLVAHNDAQSSGLWNRQKNNGSHASLNAYDTGNSRQQLGGRLAMPQSTSDGNIARRHRAASHGSASDSGVFVDSATASNLARTTSAGAKPTGNSASGWHTERSPSFENVRRGVSNQYMPRGDLPPGSQEASMRRPGPSQPPGGHGRRPPGGGRRRSSEAVDAGLSMMTSALLTMLDTPEEAAEGYEYYEDIDEQGGPPMGESRMPMMANHGQHMPAPRPHEGSRMHDNRTYRMPEADRRYDGDMFGGMMVNSPGSDSQYHDHRNIHPGDGSSNWLPSWQGTKSLEGDAQSMSVIQPRHAPNSPHSTNVGLFLP